MKKIQKNTKYRKKSNNYIDGHEVINSQNDSINSNECEYENEKLKSEIGKMKESYFVKKKSKAFQKQNIPKFPDYSDDDLL